MVIRMSEYEDLLRHITALQERVAHLERCEYVARAGNAALLEGLAPDATGAADAHVVATDVNGNAKAVDLTLAGVVTASKVRASGATTIADDAVHTIAVVGTCMLIINGRSSAYDEISCVVALRASNAPFVTILVQPSNWVEASTSVLNGTTGTNGKFTVSAVEAGGTVYLENRIGSSVSIGYTLLG